MKILVVLPDINYFLWQMLVQINNFRRLGIEQDVIYLIGKRNIQHSEALIKILDSDIKSEFHVIKDTRINPQYSSSMRPHILSKYFDKNPNRLNETFFYIDPDVIFTKKIKFNDFEKDNVWYLSDTRSYINSKYIKGKSNELFIEMCGIVGIDPKIVEENDENAGGAQYLMKNIDPNFWKKVEKDSEELFIHMRNTQKKYSPENPIQAWTADMWAILWNAWYFGHETKIAKKLNFSWATDLVEKWNVNNIYHNAGAINDEIFFVKTKYQISPFNKEIKCSDKYCSFKYLKEIKQTEKNFEKILF